MQSYYLVLVRTEYMYKRAVIFLSNESNCESLNQVFGSRILQNTYVHMHLYKNIRKYMCNDDILGRLFAELVLENSTTNYRRIQKAIHLFRSVVKR